jgi:hypothetical protein
MPIDSFAVVLFMMNHRLLHRLPPIIALGSDSDGFYSVNFSNQTDKLLSFKIRYQLGLSIKIHSSVILPTKIAAGVSNNSIEKKLIF